MAEQAYHQATLQHLAHLKQEEASVVRPDSGLLRQAWLLHQQALAEAGLEAHLQRQQQAALVAVQDLERQRLRP